MSNNCTVKYVCRDSGSKSPRNSINDDYRSDEFQLAMDL